MIFAISRAPISRMLVEHKIADGASYSRAVSAYAACVLETTSKPSRFKASPSRFAKYTLLSINKIFGPRPGGITAWPQEERRASRQLAMPFRRALAHPNSKLQ